MARRRSRRPPDGLCRECRSEPAEAGYATCRACRDRAGVTRRSIGEARVAAGRCPRDGRPAAEGSQLCRRCLDAQAGRGRGRYRRLCQLPGACQRCGRQAAAVDARFPLAADCRLCPKCWFSAASLAHFGRRGDGPALAGLFLAQGGRCALTGRDLVIGRDASLDHEVPRSRGGDRGLANVRWVHFDANMVKGRLLDAELLAECRRILAWHESPEKRRLARALRRARGAAAAGGTGC